MSLVSATSQITRRTGNYHPSIWGDYFLKYAYESEEVDSEAVQRVERQKEEVRKMLTDAKSSYQKLIQLIDTIQRLGIAYHLEREIGEILGQLNQLVYEFETLHDDLYVVSLTFRLLRQEGINVSSDVFKQFIDKEGEFKDELRRDVRGMLSLYEAAHFLKHGEPVLDQALSFTKPHLKSAMTSSDLCSFLKMQVKHALKQTIRRGMPRMEAKHFISIYHEDPLHDQLLLSFAKLDFNIVQKLHCNEIGEASRWYKGMDFKSKIPYARDRLVECYMFSFGSHSEPKFSLCRMIMTKICCISSVIGDTYDTHGTIEELEAFTASVHKWDIKCINQLEEYMKPIYHVLLDTYEEIEKLMVTEGRESHRIHYAIDVAKRHIQSYFDEAKWFHVKYVPTVEEYMEVGIVSSGCYGLGMCTFLGLGDAATEEAFKWLSKYPNIFRGTGMICRLMDDMVSHKIEQEKGHSPTSIECYVKQYDATEEAAYNYFRVQIAEAWKDLNEEWLENRDMPKPLLISAINFACFMDALYKSESCYTRSEGIMKDTIKSLFIDPIPM